jgi:DNA-binding transcriptional ArsR family regulator
MTSTAQTQDQLAALAGVFHLMGDPSRLSILMTVLAGPRPVGEIAAETGLSPSLVSHHLRLLRGGPVGDFDFVREHARRRAEQRFPLEATLHTYRCAHKVFSRWLREAAANVVSAGDARQVDRCRDNKN